MRLSRRQLLGGAGSALLLPALLARAGRAETHDHGAGLSPDGIGVRRVPFTPGAPLAEPEVRQSAGGVLETTLRLAYAYRDIGGYRLWVRTYEGMVPGPTLKLRPGDRLKIHLVNDLPPNRDTMPHYPGRNQTPK